MKLIGEKLGQLKSNDLLKGFITAMITVIVTSLYSSIQSGTIPTDWLFWKTQLMLGLGAGLSYLIKNFLTNSDDKFLKKEEPKIKA